MTRGQNRGQRCIDGRSASPVHLSMQGLVEGGVMRRFMWGLVLGIGLTYGYYEWVNLVWSSKQWFAAASAAPGAEQKVDGLFARDR